MAGNISRAEFARNLAESGLLADEVLRAAVEGPAAEPGTDDGDLMARSLIGAGHLTPFQAEAVRQRRFETLFIGNYVVLDRIGAGGMGTVYKARHRRMKRVVALKVLSREAAGRASFARRFQREVETIAQLNHPHVVMAYDADETEAGPFLVMEFIEGRDLGVEVQEGGPLSVSEAVRCTLQAARGLEYAHGRGSIHRDVKPANLLRDARRVTKVADLGLARLEDPESDEFGAVTMAGNVVGTAEYMAPEQALDSAAIDGRADLYALGCTLFFLLTGRAPYSSNSLMGLLLKHRDAPIPSLREARPDTPAELDAIFARMVAKRPDDRYASMTELIESLESIAAITDLLDRRPPTPSPGPTASPTLEATGAFGAESTASIDLIPPDNTGIDEEAVPDSSVVRRLAELVVVLIEPSRLQARIVQAYLRELGIGKVSCTSSGAEALAMVKAEGAHVLLSAMHLADMTGADLARALHSDPGCAGVGLVLASGDSEEGRSKLDHLGPPTIHLRKPFDLRDLAQSLASATRHTATYIRSRT